MPYPFSALLCIVVGVRGVAKKRAVTTNLQRLHFLAPLLAGSQLGLVLSERLKEAGRGKLRPLPLLLPCAVSLATDASSPLFYSCRTTHFFFLVPVLPCGPNPWIQEHGFPPFSFWPRIGRHFVLLLLSGWPYYLLFGFLALSLPVLLSSRCLPLRAKGCFPEHLTYTGQV